MAKKGETREVILDAAEKVFFQNGFEKTSVKMILEEAKIVTGSFYHFFPSKEALFEAVTERFLNAYAERIGGILGVFLGLSLSYALCRVIGMTFFISTDAIVLGVTFSAAVGIIFGWAPARKASRLNPIDALRAV